MIDNTIEHSTIVDQFPLLNRQVHGQKLVYLDNGATVQKPQCVIDAISHYYSEYNSNIHRGVHTLSQEATTAFEEARMSLQRFINAKHSHEVILTSGTTQSINLVAYSFGKAFIQPGDEVIVSGMEHHSNIVPWQIMCEDRGAVLKVIPFNAAGEINLDDVASLISDKTKLISLVHISNSLGTINPVKEVIELAHAKGVKVLIDGAQAAPHAHIDVQDLDADFYAFSGHKMYGPTGVGVLYGKEDLLNSMPPYIGGGEMIDNVTFEKTTYNTLPHKFEAGTPNIADVIGLGKAAEWMIEIGHEFIQKHENDLLNYATEKLSLISGFKAIGQAKNKAGVLSFVIEGMHPYDIGTILDQQGIAVRTGNHCTQPVMDKFCIPGTIRASFAIYNSREDIDKLFIALERAVKLLQ
jgi:cysteine desulfurase/selenocysteine lyase